MPPLAAAAEIAGEAGVAGEAGGAAGGMGGMGGMLKDFNDVPGMKIIGSIGGKLAHAVTSAIGTGGGSTQIDEGPVGHLA
jgi:hypothetical protein